MSAPSRTLWISIALLLLAASLSAAESAPVEPTLQSCVPPDQSPFDCP